MNINTKNEYGSIDISMETIATVAGRTATECYGVIGLTSKTSLEHYVVELLKIEDYIKGVYARKNKKGYEVDLYLVCANGVKLPEILSEVQKKVKYDLERTFEINSPPSTCMSKTSARTSKHENNRCESPEGDVYLRGEQSL
jgi:uncharacterized alkaline shock family protein YloU